MTSYTYVETCENYQHSRHSYRIPFANVFLQFVLEYCQKISVYHRKVFANIYGDQGRQFTKSSILLLIQKKSAAQNLKKKRFSDDRGRKINRRNYYVGFRAQVKRTFNGGIASFSATCYSHLKNWKRFYVAGDEGFSLLKSDTK